MWKLMEFKFFLVFHSAHFYYLCIYYIFSPERVLFHKTRHDKYVRDTIYDLKILNGCENIVRIFVSK